MGNGRRGKEPTGPKILHRPGLIRPTGSQGQSRIFGPIGSISQSIADTRHIIVVKLIKPVIAHPAAGQRKEGLRPVYVLSCITTRNQFLSSGLECSMKIRYPTKKRLFQMLWIFLWKILRLWIKRCVASHASLCSSVSCTTLASALPL